MEDLHEAGGVPAVMKYLCRIIAWSCLTVTGKNIS
jgi:dihydroxy-acid dehydratase